MPNLLLSRAAAAQIGRPMEPRTTSRPVVVVEDNPDDLFFFKRCAAKANVVNPLATAEDGEQAIALLKTFLPDASGATKPPVPLVVFLDLKLPRLSGFGVLEWIRGQRALDAVPVAILSSSAEPRDVTRAYALGAQSYLVKHPSPQDMAATIASASAVKSPSDLAALQLPGVARPTDRGR